MGGLNSLKGWFSPAQPSSAPMNDPFIKIDREKLVERLDVRGRAERNGAENVPQSDARSLDAVESDITASIVEHFSQAQIEAGNNLRAYDSRLAGLKLMNGLSGIPVSANQAVSEFEAEARQRHMELSEARTRVTESHQELMQFRLENGLARPAYPKAPAVKTYGVIGSAWLVETAINASLLRVNDDLGLLGGVVAAGAIGAINVGVGAFVGQSLWPRTNLKDPTQRRIAVAACGLWGAFVIVWNLLAAHYRDAKALGLERPEQQALAMFFGPLDSIYSWALFIAGVAFALLACRAGYKSDDPYPGYGEVARRYEGFCQDYAEDVRLAYEHLLDIRDEAVGDAERVRSDLSQQHAEQQQILAARATLCRRFKEYALELQQVGNAILQEYRTINRRVRSAPAPVYFNEDWRLNFDPLPAAVVHEVTAGEIQDAERALLAAVREINQAFDAAIKRFEPIDELKRSLGNG